jgi:hypothetical protein
LDRAGPFFFREPAHAWDKIEEEIRVVPFDAWTFARIAYLTGESPTNLIALNFAWLSISLDVCNHERHTVASMRFCATGHTWQLEGRAETYLTGRKATAELKACLLSEPLSLTPFELNAPGRGNIGWDGQHFLEERTFSPPQSAYTEKFEFRIHEAKLMQSSELEVKKRRFTGKWPPPALLETVPNWIFALDEECRPGQDETTLKPATNQQTIDYHIAYTSGEAWLPDGRILPCLIGLDDGQPASVICLDDDTAWEVPCHPKGVIVEMCLAAEHEDRFPIRVVSRLSQSKRDPSMTVRLMITKDGKVLPWDFKQAQ